jgi:hypothetical protein
LDFTAPVEAPVIVSVRPIKPVTQKKKKISSAEVS